MTQTSYRSLAAAGLALAFIGATASAAPLLQKPAVPATDFGYDLHYAGDLGAFVAGEFDLAGPAASSTIRGIDDLAIILAATAAMEAATKASKGTPANTNCGERRSLRDLSIGIVRG
jgi:hypothetical protein